MYIIGLKLYEFLTCTLRFQVTSSKYVFQAQFFQSGMYIPPKKGKMSKMQENTELIFLFKFQLI